MRVTISLGEAEKAKLEAYADQHGLTVSGIIAACSLHLDQIALLGVMKDARDRRKERERDSNGRLTATPTGDRI